MIINQTTCANCGGTGKMVVWKTVSVDENLGIGTMQREENVCENCNGNGYSEYATFSVEEAKAILEHCGLSTES